MEETTITKRQVIQEMEAYLDSTEAQFKRIKQNSDRIYKRTSRVIQIVFFSIGLVLIANMYFIYDFTQGILSMISSMNEMYLHFGNMTAHVHGITESVVSMTTHIEVLPNMAENINSMNHTVANMNNNVQSMQGEVGIMAQDVGSINNSLGDMTHRFDQVNGDMDKIGESVHQMSRVVP